MARYYSECCAAEILPHLVGGKDADVPGEMVLTGVCSGCGSFVMREHPKTGEPEWLDGQDPRTTEPLRPLVPRAVACA